MKPIVVAVWCGEGMPNVHEFVTPFVEELEILLKHGLRFNNHIIDISIRSFLCDTQARCFVKVSYNHYHGCSKCVIIGEYHHDGRHMSYPRIDAALRTNTSFRQRFDPDHHKEETPLERLDIDLIHCFPVAVPLHLIDLGIMKRNLLSWVIGSFNFKTKFSGRDIECISSFLVECNIRIPSEIHRAVRPLDCIKFWKGLEFRTFLLYLGPVILKFHLQREVYNHFMLLFCAVTICSSKFYRHFLDIADELFKCYIKQAIDIYGIDSISSNVHNLCHVVDDVKRFGPLHSLSTYPFESYLGQIKNLLRSGNLPLEQIARRITESSNADDDMFLNCSKCHTLKILFVEALNFKNYIYQKK